jgi:hypothetical protein
MSEPVDNNNNNNNNNNSNQPQAPSIESLIDMNVANSLQEMGYSKNVSQKACLFNQSNIDKCLDWIMMHINDPDFEEEAKIEVNQNQPVSKLSKEEAAAKARELQELARKKHEENQKKMDEEHEKMRIQSTKEILKAKRAEEERQMQMYLIKKKKDEEENERAKREILEQIARDKAERFGKKYVPGEIDDKPKVYSKEENVQYYLKNIKLVYSPFRAGDTLKNCFSTMKVILNNILKHEGEEKFTKVKLTNPNVHERIGKIETAIKCLEELGFVKDGDFMVCNKVDKELFQKTIKFLENELNKLN